MAVIHTRKKFIKVARYIESGKNKYALNAIKYESVFFILVWLGFRLIFHKENEFLVIIAGLVFYCFPMTLFYYFYFRDKWIELIYDYNDTIDHYSKTDPSFFEGIHYEKYKISYTSDLVIIEKKM